MDTLITVEYQNNNAIIDINKKEIKTFARGKVWINPYEYFPD